MKLWQALYAMIWIDLIEFLIVMTPNRADWLVYLHVVPGLVIVGLAYYNYNGVRQTAVPGRVKRIAASTLQLSVLTAILGVILVPMFFLNLQNAWMIPVVNISLYGIILLVHVVNAFAIITQAAAVAIAYDMWEDKEFAKETAPGEVPPAPTPKAAATTQKP